MDTTAADYQAKKAAYFAKADSMFSFVAEKVPDSYLGHFWRARVNSALDPENRQGARQTVLRKDDRSTGRQRRRRSPHLYRVLQLPGLLLLCQGRHRKLEDLLGEDSRDRSDQRNR